MSMPRTGEHRSPYLRKPGNGRPDRATPRLCLKCRAPFESAWAGERVCAKCKTTRIWRDGVGDDVASWGRR
ncbi:MAG TPA: hypothetical protein VGA19_08345 [Rhodospirillales bacterium]|jgi:hypothetical protein